MMSAGRIAAALLPAFLCAPAAAQTPGVEVPAELFVVDPQTLAEERAANAAVVAARDALVAGGGALHAPAGVRELAVREAALLALRNNIAIKRGGLGQGLAQRTLEEAEALFDPVFAVSLTGTLTANYRRVMKTTRFKPNTERIAVGATDRTGLFSCTTYLAQISSGADRGVACHVIVLADQAVTTNVNVQPRPRTPITVTQYNRERPEGYYQEDTVANDPSDYEPQHRSAVTGTLSVFQQLPWGASLNLTLGVQKKETYYGLNQYNGFEGTYGGYNRPYYSTLTIGATLPLPGTMNYGPKAAPADVQGAIAREGVTAADLDLGATVNQTLLEVDSLFWSLAGTALRLQAVARTLTLAQDFRSRLERRAGEGLVGQADLQQADAQIASLEATRQALFADHLTLSGALAERLADGNAGQALYAPVGYRAALAGPVASIEQPERALDNPLYRRQGIAVRVAGILRDQRAAQTRPNLTLTASLQFRQAGSFGFRNLSDSLVNIASPDVVTQSLTLLYQRPIGNRAARAAFDRSTHDLNRQTILLERVEAEVTTEWENARLDIASARARIRITRRALDLARDVYARAGRLEQAGFTTGYETLAKLNALQQAEDEHIQAQIELRLAESRLLASVGGLAERYAERTAQTPADRERIARLQRTGTLRQWGGPG